MPEYIRSRKVTVTLKDISSFLGRDHTLLLRNIIIKKGLYKGPYKRYSRKEAKAIMIAFYEDRGRKVLEPSQHYEAYAKFKNAGLAAKSAVESEAKQEDDEEKVS